MATKAKTPKARSEPFVPSTAAVLLDKYAVAKALGCSVRKLGELMAAGTYPKPDAKIGILNRWTVAAHNEAVAKLSTRRPTDAGGVKAT
jgi:hypothetical protein